MVYSVWPVFMTLDLVEVCVTSYMLLPLVTVVVVTISSSDVEKRSLVLMMGVERGGAVGVVLGGGVLRCVGVDCPRLGSGFGVGVAGSVVGSVDGSLGVGVGCGVGVGRGVDGCGWGVDGAGVFPAVPEAWRFSPWWRYSSMPSMCKPSPKLKADDTATSAYKASSHELRSMANVVAV